MNNNKSPFRTVTGVLSVALLLGLTACGDGEDADTDAGEDANGAEAEAETNGDDDAEDGEDADGDSAEGIEDSYTVATDSSFVPFEFEQDGEHVGFDMDIIQAIADEVGFEIELDVTNFDGIIPGLQTGAFDIAIAGITITEERAESVDFTDPYYQSGTRIAVQSDNDEIEEMDDLAGHTVAARLGSAPLDYLEENVPDAETQPFEQLDQMYLAVEGGSADALLYDAPNVEYYISTTDDTNLEVVGPLYEAQEYGMAVSQGNEELVSAMNEALAGLLEDGTYADIHEEWFGEVPEWIDDIAEMGQGS